MCAAEAGLCVHCALSDFVQWMRGGKRCMQSVGSHSVISCNISLPIAVPKRVCVVVVVCGGGYRGKGPVSSYIWFMDCSSDYRRLAQLVWRAP